MSVPPTRSNGTELRLEVVITAASFILLAALSFFTRAPTPIDLVAVSSAVTVRTGGEDVVLPAFIAESVTILGSGDVVGLSGTAAASKLDDALTLSRLADQPALNVQGLRVPARAILTLRRDASEPRTIEIVIKTADSKGAAPAMTVFARGRFQADGAGVNATLDAKTPRSIRIALQGDTLVARVKLGERSWATQRPFEISGLSFLDDDPTNTAPDLFSSIDSGQVTFVEIGSLIGGNREMRLRPGQFLRIEEISRGFVRSLSFAEDRLSIGFSGEVGALETSWRNFRQDHMPSWLAYVTSLDGAKELATTLVALLMIAYKLFSSWGAT